MVIALNGVGGLTAVNFSRDATWLQCLATRDGPVPSPRAAANHNPGREDSSIHGGRNRRIHMN